MCGAVSGFHALVSSGTTPKMVEKESHIRGIGYGAMLIESLVGVTALIAAAALPPQLYYDINVAIDDAPKWQQQVERGQRAYGPPPRRRTRCTRRAFPASATWTWARSRRRSAASRYAAGPAGR